MSQNHVSERNLQALRFLRNAIMHDGHSPSVRDLAKALGYKSPRSALLVLNDLIEHGWLKRKPNGELQFRNESPLAENHARTTAVPLVGTVACGVPLLAEENIEGYVSVSTSLAKPGGKYFLLRAAGDSMNEAGIENGDFVLVRQQQVAENGQNVVALIDDEATIKELRKERDVVVLRPRSTNKVHSPIVLDRDFAIQGIVVATIPKI